MPTYIGRSQATSCTSSTSRLGFLRELTAQGHKAPPDLYFMYEFHFTLPSSRYSAELTAQGAERPRGLLLRVRVPPHAVGRLGLLGAHGAGRYSALDLYFMYEPHLTLCQRWGCHGHCASL